MRLSRRLVPLVAVLASLALVVAACGDDDATTTTTTAAPATTTTAAETTTTAAETTTTAAETTTTVGEDLGVTEAKAIVEALTAASAFDFQGPAIAAAGALDGKRIYAIGNGLEYFFVKNWLAGVEEAGVVDEG